MFRSWTRRRQKIREDVLVALIAEKPAGITPAGSIPKCYRMTPTITETCSRFPSDVVRWAVTVC
ncbi:MAG: hypothetical protein LBC70_04100 [Chitinispirillales bacterium]|nr:hypothetical protein [Chitinispirillales bacterium]